MWLTIGLISPKKSSYHIKWLQRVEKCYWLSIGLTSLININMNDDNTLLIKSFGKICKSEFEWLIWSIDQFPSSTQFTSFPFDVEPNKTICYVLITYFIKSIGYLCNMLHNMRVSSTSANLFPMHILGPWPKGKEENGWVFGLLDLSQRSGLNL